MTDYPEPRLRVIRRRVAWGSALLGLVAAVVVVYVTVTNASKPPAVEEADAVQRAMQMGKPMVVEFGANACASCRAMKPILDALQREHGDQIAVLSIDITKERGYASRYRILVMPTQVFFDAQGREIGRNLGGITGPEILAQLGVALREPAR